MKWVFLCARPRLPRAEHHRPRRRRPGPVDAGAPERPNPRSYGTEPPRFVRRRGRAPLAFVDRGSAEGSRAAKPGVERTAGVGVNPTDLFGGPFPGLLAPLH